MAMGTNTIPRERIFTPPGTPVTPYTRGVIDFLHRFYSDEPGAFLANHEPSIGDCMPATLTMFRDLGPMDPRNFKLMYMKMSQFQIDRSHAMRSQQDPRYMNGRSPIGKYHYSVEAHSSVIIDPSNGTVRVFDRDFVLEEIKKEGVTKVVTLNLEQVTKRLTSEKLLPMMEGEHYEKHRVFGAEWAVEARKARNTYDRMKAAA